jgi:hypothetical protein
MTITKMVLGLGISADRFDSTAVRIFFHLYAKQQGFSDPSKLSDLRYSWSHLDEIGWTPPKKGLVYYQ